MSMYACNTSMVDTAFYSSDGDLMIIPQLGDLMIQTEFGFLSVQPTEIAVIQRGIKFSVEVEGEARGYVCEIYKSHFILPDLGPIGANGSANGRDFSYPKAHFEDRDCEFRIINKYLGEFFEAEMEHSIYDVVGWHGNYAPYKYDLKRFNTMGSISFDHPDPSIFTVMTCQTDDPGQAVCDFVIFPERWLVAENTFRPPYYHRNTMSEFMGNICGVYDAKEEGFIPGSASLHSTMTPHGPEAGVFEKASTSKLAPQKISAGGLAFMWETAYVMTVTDYAVDHNNLDNNYYKVSKFLKILVLAWT
jgi:homogentisate 1,2-dioxygenase